MTGRAAFFSGTTAAAAMLLLGSGVQAQPQVDEQVPPPGDHIGPGDLGSQRELSSVELQLDPPRLIGERTDLRVSGGQLTGAVQGAKFTAAVSNDRVVGVGPIGKIDLAVTVRPREVRFDGTWNGQPMHVSVAPDGVRGRVMRMARVGSIEVQACDLQIDQTKGNDLRGQGECRGGSEPLRFSVHTPGRMTLVEPDAALLMVAYLAGPPAPPVRSGPLGRR